MLAFRIKTAYLINFGRQILLELLNFFKCSLTPSNFGTSGTTPEALLSFYLGFIKVTIHLLPHRALVISSGLAVRKEQGALWEHSAWSKPRKVFFLPSLVTSENIPFPGKKFGAPDNHVEVDRSPVLCWESAGGDMCRLSYLWGCLLQPDLLSATIFASCLPGRCLVTSMTLRLCSL